MKRVCVHLLAFTALILTTPASAQQNVELRGMVNTPGLQLAFLQIDQKTFGLQASNHLTEVYRGKTIEIEVRDIDFATETVKTRIDGLDYTNSLPAPHHPSASSGFIHLHQLDFPTFMDLYGRLADRTILLHPQASHDAFSCDLHWSAPDTNLSAIANSLTNLFAGHDLAALPDGDVFIQVLPAKTANSAVLGAKDLKTNGPASLGRGMIDFKSVDFSDVVRIYGKLINRTQKPSQPSPAGTITFKTSCPLTKEQVIYAFETLFRFHSTKVVLNDDNTFSVVMTDH